VFKYEKQILPSTDSDPVSQDHVPEDLGQLRMGQRQSPKPEIGRSVRDRPESVLDGVDPL